MICEHSVQFFDNETFLIRKVLEFLVPGVQRGEGAIMIATRRHIRQAQELLASDDRHRSADAGDRIMWVDADETMNRFVIGGKIDEGRFDHVAGALLSRASEHGTRPVRVFGEMVALLLEQGNADAALQLEHCWHRLQSSRDFGLVCGYPMSAFTGEPQRALFEAVCDAHTHVNPLEQTESALAAQQLHRMVAHLQREANALEQLRARQRVHVADGVDPFDDRHRTPADPDAEQESFSEPSGADAKNSTDDLLTVEAAALKMRLTRPHVLKLVAEHRFNDVVQPEGGLPLIPLREVDRVASEIENR